MVLICSKCEARLQLDEAKAPSRPFTVRCPKCQASVSVQPGTATTVEPGTPDTATSPDAPSGRTFFERPVTAPRFTPTREESEAASVTQAGALPGLNDLAKLLAEAMRQSDGVAAAGRGRTRPAWDRRKVLVCASPAYREAKALRLADRGFTGFAAAPTAPGWVRGREERMNRPS